MGADSASGDGAGAVDRPAVLGAVLAGGRGSRLGGDKAWVELGGRPLCSYPLAAIEAAGLDPVLCVKQAEPPGPSVRLYGTKEPRDEVPVLEEPDEPRHPLAGIVTALRAGEGRPVVVVACDMPFITPDLVAFLAAAAEPLVVPVHDGRPQPLLGRYEASLLPDLEAALERDEPLTRTIESLHPRLVAADELSRFGDPHRLLFNVNDPDDLRRAEALL